MFDFDTVIERRGTNSFKWDGNERQFGEAGLLPFWVADMDFATPQPILDAIAARLRHPVLGYEERPAAYTGAVRGWLERRHGWEVPAEWLVYCPPSAIVAMYGLLLTESEPGDGVLVPAPTYGPLLGFVGDSGRRLQAVPMVEDQGRYRLDLDGLAEAADDRSRILILCNPHNPTGRVFSDDELAALRDFAASRELFVISDEVHADLTRPGYRHVPFGSLGYTRSATVISPNKTFNTAGLPQATVVLPEAATRGRLRQFLDTVQLNHDTTFGGIAMMAGYQHCEDWLDAVRDYIDANHVALADFVSQAEGLSLYPAEGTYLAWLDYRAVGVSEEQMLAALKTAGVALYGGSLFGEAGRGFLRMNVACPRRTLNAGMASISRALDLVRAAGGNT